MELDICIRSSVGDPMIKLISMIFADCVSGRRVTAIWKSSRTVLLYKKGVEFEMKNWRLISITCFVYCLFPAGITKWIQDQHSANELQVFSRSQKRFVQGQAGCIEHAVLTREMISHATLHLKDMYMVQIDNRSKITLTGGETSFIQWQSGTVQACPLSPTLFNICLDRFLCRLEKEDMKKLGYSIRLEDGSHSKINAGAYADDLILYSESHENMEIMLNLRAAFCSYAKMKANAEKCVTISQAIINAKRPQPTNDWRAIASEVGTRSAMQCCERWRRYLDPAIRNGEWTNEEDELLERKARDTSSSAFLNSFSLF
jgi:hypothetical protein